MGHGLKGGAMVQTILLLPELQLVVARVRVLRCARCQGVRAHVRVLPDITGRMELPAVKRFLGSIGDDECLVLVQDFQSKSGLTYCNPLIYIEVPVCLGHGDHRYLYCLGGIKLLSKPLAQVPRDYWAVAEFRDLTGDVEDMVLLARQVSLAEWFPTEQEEACPSCRKEIAQQQEDCC